MAGDERQKFCEHCKSNVYNLDLMSADERLRLMDGREGHACGRYRLAIRKAAPGYERQYMRHLLTHGVAVGAVSGVLLTVWQLWGPLKISAPPGANDYFATASSSGEFPMPREYMKNREAFVLGGFAVCIPELGPQEFRTVEIPEISPSPLRVTFDPNDIIPSLDELEKIETIPASIK
jgi:hypothetical protein